MLELAAVALARVVLVNETVCTADLAEARLEQTLDRAVPVYEFRGRDLVLGLEGLARRRRLLLLLLKLRVLLELVELLARVRKLARKITRRVQLRIRDGLLEAVPQYSPGRAIHVPVCNEVGGHEAGAVERLKPHLDVLHLCKLASEFQLPGRDHAATICSGGEQLLQLVPLLVVRDANPGLVDHLVLGQARYR